MRLTLLWKVSLSLSELVHSSGWRKEPFFRFFISNDVQIYAIHASKWTLMLMNYAVQGHLKADHRLRKPDLINAEQF